ncbi:N-acetylmuramoyl-L-alanine amidase [Streptomyces rochei]|uniref:N-acetylmuramoyl-L-alanine amidase n=1 Tax=Streptomyces rochei TaxID=1928 RepID=UPI0036FCCC57
MATPLSASAFLKALRDEGLTVVEVGDWEDHNRNSRGPWGPVHAVLLHHTVTKGSAATVETCRKGYEGLPGPLCHGVITKDGRVHLVGYGRANHAGLGDDDVLRAVINETALPADNETSTDGNRHFYGFECENLGDNKDPWPAAQVDAMVRASAALLRAHGWNKDGEGGISVIAHAEWQPGKIDPRGPGYPGHAGIRARVAERLRHPASWSPGSTAPAKPVPTIPQEDDMPSAAEIAAAVMEYKVDDPRTEGTQYVPFKTVAWWTGADAAQANAAVRAQAATIEKLVATVATLAAGVSDLDPAEIVADLKAAIESIEVRLVTQEG